MKIVCRTCVDDVTSYDTHYICKKCASKLWDEIFRLRKVVEAVKNCGARIQTIGEGFDAKNVWVIERREMDKIGEALRELERK